LTITQLQDKNAISKYRFAIRQKGGQSHGDWPHCDFYGFDTLVKLNGNLKV
jgi:hypothetical protein